MFNKFIRSIRGGREDAKAVVAWPRFLAVMESIEGLPAELQGVVASGFVGCMKNFGDSARSALSEHLRSDYLNHVQANDLQRAADHFFSRARTFDANAVLGRSNPELVHEAAAGTLFALGLQLVGYYLLARSWLDLEISMDLDYSDPSVLSSAPLIGTSIRMRIEELLAKCGHRPPF